MTQTTDQPLTDLSGLTDEQRRGATCVYCGVTVRTGSAVDLGERRDADNIRVFPRAHPECAEAAQ
ncbi:hypothetical protein [Streptomyces sp. DW26H14]|uniref:hypothetical protein n=1 Tax=Streptomyces sp. DW26H14 TaxID=3435395 RepID=UPI00403D9083